MDLVWTLVFCLLLSLSESRPESRPDFSPAPGPDPEQVTSTAPPSDQSRFYRLPGLCRRLKRRRISLMCNLEKFCWSPEDQTRNRSGQVCRCPRGLRCSNFFIHSL